MNINIVNDPPFFPIARYQRQENIHKTASVDEKVGLTTDQGFKAVTDKSPAPAATTAISAPAAPQKGGMQTGAILNVKI